MIDRQELINEGGRVLIGELAETMPEWQAIKIAAAIQSLIAAHLEPADSAPKSDRPTFEPPKVG